jgi:pyruvate,water dikinase
MSRTTTTPPPRTTDGQRGASLAAAQLNDDWPADGLRARQPFDVWTRANVEEAFPQPVSPLTWSTVPQLHGGSFRVMLGAFRLPIAGQVQLLGRFYGRVYFNEGALRRVMCGELGLPESALETGMGGPRSAVPPRYRRLSLPRLLRHLPGFVRTVRRQQQAVRALPRLFAEVDAWAGEFATFAATTLPQVDEAAVWAELERRMERFSRALDEYNLVLTAAVRSFQRLAQVVERWTGRGGLAGGLVAGLSGIHAAEMGAALWKLADAIRVAGVEEVAESDPAMALARLRASPAAQPVLDELDAFLRRYGHRCPNETEWLHPRWAEAPERVVEVVAGYLTAGDQSRSAVEGGASRRREQTTATVEARLNPLQRARFRRLLLSAQEAVRLRDNGRHFVMKAAFPVRRLYAELGERWAQRGWLLRPQDVFFLAHAELAAVVANGSPDEARLDLRRTVAGRRAAYDHWFTVEPPSALAADGTPLGAPGTPVPAAQTALGPNAARTPEPGLILDGIAGSGGRATGTARLVGHPGQAAGLKPGDILVTHATDPGWTVVFPLVAAVVLETGGQLSHGAIVAREYGLPAVLSVRDATRLIRDGQTITVDGTTGRVHLE